MAMVDIGILIAGAGPAGLTLALALQQAGHKPLLVDARPPGQRPADTRILALSHGSRQILERLGVWPQLTPTPIHTIHISQRGGFGRTRLTATEHELPALGYVLDAASLTSALDAAATQRGVQRLEATQVKAVVSKDDQAEVSLNNSAEDTNITAQLVAYAEGKVADNTESVSRDYHQHAIACLATPREPHRNIAYERFTAAGPLALLPLGASYSVILTDETGGAAQIMALDDSAFLRHLQQQIGERVHFTAVTPRVSVPLSLRYRHSPIAARQVWLGNAAQTLHPVAGQGFNLALRDVWTLAAALRNAADPGSAALLQRYHASRRLDRCGAMGFTDGLIRLFSNDNLLLRVARGAGLLALDLVPPGKNFVARRMMFGARAWL